MLSTNDLNKIPEIIRSIEQNIAEQFAGEATGHDWFHIQRVRQMAQNIQVTEGGNADLIDLIALLHDISDYKFNGGDAYKGGEISYQIVIENGGSQNLAEQVKYSVNNISYKGANVEIAVIDLETQIVQDADRIDAVGAIGVGRTFAYGGAKGSEMYNPNIPPVLHDSFEAYKSTKGTTVNHFYEKLLLLKDRMNTPTGTRIATERTQFMQQFLEQFLHEWHFEHGK